MALQVVSEVIAVQPAVVRQTVDHSSHFLVVRGGTASEKSSFTNVKFLL